MEKYLEGEELIPATIKRKAIRKATVPIKMVPVTCGTSYKNKGVQKLLDAIVDYMPSPLDIPPSRAPTPRPTRKSAVIRRTTRRSRLWPSRS
jgi:elongation factor G